MTTIIDNTKPRAPIFEYEPTPIFRTTLEEQKYWQEEKRRWLEGYGEMTGPLYYYATQIKLKDRLTGRIFRPTVRDADLIIFKAIEDAQKEGNALYFLKARGIGFSSIGMALPFYYFRVFPNSNCVATSKDKKTLATLFKDKTIIAYENFESPYVKPDILAKNETANESYLSVGMKYLNEDGKEKYATSNLYCRDTQESDKAATNFSGGGAIYGFADEASLMPRLMLFFNSAIEIFKNTDGKIAGTLVMGGTAEASMGAEHIQKIQGIWENADALNIKPLFLPATYGKYMTNGWSDHKKAEEEILKEREKKAKLNDGGESLKAYIKNHPLTIEDIFDFGGSSRFDDYAVQCINEQTKIVLKDPAMPKYDIIESNGEVVAVPTKNGKIEILEHPKPNVKYVIGIDGIMTSQLTSSEKDSKTSKFSCITMKGVDPQADLQFAPICRYSERPKSIQDANETAIRILKYYNKYDKAGMIGELNAGGEHIVKLAMTKGLFHKMIIRKDLNKKGFVDTNKVWFYRNDAIKEWQNEAANVYFKKYAGMVKYIDLLKDAQKNITDNTDDLDAFMACLYGWGTGDLLEEKTIERKPRKISICRWNPLTNKYEWTEVG
jgi:hypothetical protein